jgi:hypothetical protein
MQQLMKALLFSSRIKTLRFSAGLTYKAFSHSTHYEGVGSFKDLSITILLYF